MKDILATRMVNPADRECSPEVPVEFTPSDYVANAIRTKSDIFKLGHAKMADWDVACSHAVAAGELMRQLKRAVFGGKGEPAALPMRLPAGMTPDMLHAFMGILNETGELASMVGDASLPGAQFNPTNWVEELGDLLWFIGLACHASGSSMEEVMRRNIAKLKARFPDKFDPAQMDDANRNLDAERRALEGEAAREMVMDMTGEIDPQHEV